MLLTNPDLTWMRDLQSRAMPGTVVIERYTLTSDGQGGSYETWSAVGTALMRIYPQRVQGLEREGGGQILSETKWWGSGTVGTDVIAQDRLRYQSRTWEVIRTNNDEMWATALRCELVAHNEESRT